MGQVGARPQNEVADKLIDNEGAKGRETRPSGSGNSPKVTLSTSHPPRDDDGQREHDDANLGIQAQWPLRPGGALLDSIDPLKQPPIHVSPLRSRRDLCPHSDRFLLRCLRLPAGLLRPLGSRPASHALPPETHGGSKTRHIVSTGPDTNHTREPVRPEIEPGDAWRRRCRHSTPGAGARERRTGARLYGV